MSPARQAANDEVRAAIADHLRSGRSAATLARVNAARDRCNELVRAEARSRSNGSSHRSGGESTEQMCERLAREHDEWLLGPEFEAQCRAREREARRARGPLVWGS